MKMLDKFKIKHALTKYTYEELIAINRFVQEELKRRRKTINEINNK